MGRANAKTVQAISNTTNNSFSVVIMSAPEI